MIRLCVQFERMTLKSQMYCSGQHFFLFFFFKIAFVASSSGLGRDVGVSRLGGRLARASLNETNDEIPFFSSTHDSTNGKNTHLRP